MVNERIKSGFCHDWSKIPDQVNKVSILKSNASIVSFRRVMKSHHGLREFQNIKQLFAYNVDDSFLREISCLSELNYLWAENISACDLSPLIQLDTLEFLILRSVRKADNFAFVSNMPQLRHLDLEWVKHLSDLSDFRDKKNLISFGIEGATSTSMTQIIDSLEPILDWPQLHSLYLNNTRLLNGNLKCLARIKSLKYLETARFYPKSEFDALKLALPELQCQWFDNWEIKLP